MSRKWESNVFWPHEVQTEYNSQQLARIGEKKIFHESDVHHVQKVGIKRFWGDEVQVNDNSQQLARIGEKKIFHEVYIHHVQKLGIKRFWAKEAKISLTANSSLESVRENFTSTRRRTCVKIWNQMFLGSEGRYESNSHQLFPKAT